MIEKNREKFMAIKELNLPLGQYAITGSGPIGIRNLREIGDIDIIVDQKLWDNLVKKYGEITENDVRKIMFTNGFIEAFGDCSFSSQQSDPNIPSVTERISQAEIIDGIPFESLNHVLYFKRKMGREKDLYDISLIEVWRKLHGKD